MRPVFKAFLLFCALAMVVVTAGSVYLMSSGFSARPDPGGFETFAALRIRNMAISRQARDLVNPEERTPEIIASGREHFADHCASCHANDGSGNTALGQGLYPRAPDMRLARTQELSDGELFYIIENGVRLTGMPAWGTGEASGIAASWHLVHFIRHLPEVSEPELEEMAGLNPAPPAEVRQRILEQQFLEGGDPVPPSTATPASPHKH
ncbi:MAG TPA: c-type cytochrome [Vicinamibacterales bacterium]|nr:c-type cytochrome [Vicinamibacterales bacterium]